MPLVKISEESIRRVAEIISGGGLAAFPTETVYGLGGDAYNPAALAKIFEAKGRPRFDPLIVHIAAVEALECVADTGLLDGAARKNLAALAGRFWPGPLTLVLPKRDAVPGLATSGLPTVAVRIPAHDAARRLIMLSTGAVAAPSANPFGYLSPTRAEHVLEMLGDKAGLILDGGPTTVGLESTVLDISGGQSRILRPGGTPKEAIEAVIGPVAVGLVAGESAESVPASENGMASPGMLKSHYAPRVPLSVYGNDSPGAMPNQPGAALLFFDGASRDAWLAGQRPPVNAAAIEVLSETGDTIEAAARLFETLHRLDSSGVERIHTQLAGDKGLGAAINDRLKRAAVYPQ